MGGLVGGPFARFSITGWGYSKTAAPAEESDEAERGEEGGPLARGLIGALVGAIAGLPLAGLVMLVWLSVAASPWGSGVWSDGDARGATFSTDDPAVLVTFAAVVGSCALIGAAVSVSVQEHQNSVTCRALIVRGTKVSVTLGHENP